MGYKAINQIHWVDGKVWMSWSEEQCRDYATAMDQAGVRWGINWLDTEARQDRDHKLDRDDWDHGDWTK